MDVARGVGLFRVCGANFRVDADVRRLPVLRLQVNSIRWLLLGAAMLVSPIVAAQTPTYVPATTYQSGTTGVNGNAMFRYNLAGGSVVDVTLTAAGTTYSGGRYAYNVRTPNASMNVGAALTGHFYPTTLAPASIPGAILDAWGIGCPNPGTTAPVAGVTCAGRGTLTITFSMPVKDPIIHFAGLGVAINSVLYNTFYSLASASNGATSVAATFTEMQGNAVFDVNGTGTTVYHSGRADGVNTSCTAGNPQAACGSARVNGTVDRIVLNVSLRGWGSTATAAYRQDNSAGNDEGHSVGVSLAPASDVVISKTNTPLVSSLDQSADTVTLGAPTTYTIVVRNNGPNAADGSLLSDPTIASLNCTSATCSASGGSACPAQTGAALATAMQTAPGALIPTLPPNGVVTVQMVCTPQ